MEVRARLFREDGTVKDVTDKLEGADEYFGAWKSNVETPHRQSVIAWQRADEAHQAGTGRPAYRVVYRTLRMLPYPAVEMIWPNLRVVFANGDVERGGVDFKDTIPGRRVDQHVIPEHGRVVPNALGPGVIYLCCPNLHFTAAGWEETVQAISYVEVLWVGDDMRQDPLKLLEEGRNAVSPLLTLLEFQFGPRLLSTRMLEEVGETFDDWHWNRQISTGTVYAETQASLIHLQERDLITQAHLLIEGNQELPVEERRRFRLASRWYWSVQEETDSVLAFIHWWLIIECLEMVKTTDIRPVRSRLATLLECGEDAVKERVGRLFGFRSRLLHGEERKVTEEELHSVETIARLFLATRAGAPAAREKEAARALFGVTGDDVRP